MVATETYTAKCPCSWQIEGLRDRVTAERAAEFHEVRNARRAYAHDTAVVPVSVRKNTRLVYAA